MIIREPKRLCERRRRELRSPSLGVAKLRLRLHRYSDSTFIQTFQSLSLRHIVYNMRLLAIIFLLFSLAQLVHNQSTNWKNVKVKPADLLKIGFLTMNFLQHQRTAELKRRQSNRNFPKITKNRLTYFADLKTNERHFKRTLDKILKVRVPDTPGIREVRQFINNEMTGLGWTVEEDTFRENTVVGPVEFTNIIATLNPDAPRRMVIACHYDSKKDPQGFLGATDSAVPCAQMINLAHTMKLDLDDHKVNPGKELTLQFIFFDGEEAFVQWTKTDSIYGARHLAEKLQGSNFAYNRIQGNQLDRMDIFVLLDLLGAKNPNIISSQTSTDPWFRKLVEIESGLNEIGAISGPRIFSTMSARNLGIEDDHIPFQQRGIFEMILNWF